MTAAKLCIPFRCCSPSPRLQTQTPGWWTTALLKRNLCKDTQGHGMTLQLSLLRPWKTWSKGFYLISLTWPVIFRAFPPVISIPRLQEIWRVAPLNAVETKRNNTLSHIVETWSDRKQDSKKIKSNSLIESNKTISLVVLFLFQAAELPGREKNKKHTHTAY